MFLWNWHSKFHFNEIIFFSPLQLRNENDDDERRSGFIERHREFVVKKRRRRRKRSECKRTKKEATNSALLALNPRGFTVTWVVRSKRLDGPQSKMVFLETLDVIHNSKPCSRQRRVLFKLKISIPNSLKFLLRHQSQVWKSKIREIVCNFT